MRVIVGWRGPERQAASTNTMSQFETDVFTQGHNLEWFARLTARWVDRAMAHTTHRRAPTSTWVVIVLGVIGGDEGLAKGAMCASKVIPERIASIRAVRGNVGLI